KAEDGIRARNVTGVQTCALPIFDPGPPRTQPPPAGRSRLKAGNTARNQPTSQPVNSAPASPDSIRGLPERSRHRKEDPGSRPGRSEERRAGKSARSGRSGHEETT